MIHKLQAMNFTEAKMAIITAGLVTNFLHGDVRQFCYPWYTTLSQPGSTASVFNQATWPYTQFARETGSDKPPSRGTGFPSDLIT